MREIGLNKRASPNLGKNNNIEKFSRWDCILHDYLASLQDDTESLSDDENYRIVLSMQEMLSDILTEFVNANQFRDTWSSPSRMHLLPFAQYASLISSKLSIKFTFGIELEGFVLDTRILNPWHLKSMKDSFWAELVSLCELGEFRFVDDEGVDTRDKQIARLSRFNNSSLFSLFRSYILSEISLEEPIQNLGALEVRWEHDISWRDLTSKGARAFEILYKTNYLLYRAECVRGKVDHK